MTGSEAAMKIKEYTEICDEFDRTPRSLMRKDVLILRDGARAKRIGDEMIDGNYRSLSRDAVAYGSVDEVIEQLSVYSELGGKPMPMPGKRTGNPSNEPKPILGG